MKRYSYQNLSSGLAEDESLLDLKVFFNFSWKIIISFTIIGITGAILYIWAVPNQFEASAKISLAQIAKPIQNSEANFFVVDIENIKTIIARMQSQNAYPKEILEICGLIGQTDITLNLPKKIKLTAHKDLEGIINLNVINLSKEGAVACANGIYQIIKTNYEEKVSGYNNEINNLLRANQQRLNQIKLENDKFKNTDGSVAIAYLVHYYEIQSLVNQNSNLKKAIIFNESRQTHLLEPIFLNDKPVIPKKRNILLIGFLFGGFLGLLAALVRSWYQTNFIKLGYLFSKSKL